jgi:adenosine deaminase
MLELAREFQIALPASDPDSLAEAMRAADSNNLAEYLERFAITLSLMQTPDALERTAYELALDSAAENVRYLEVRYSPVLHTDRGMSLEEAVAAPLRGLARAEEELGLRTGLIVCAIRSFDPSVSLELARLAVAHKDAGVVAFDLAGGEAGNPAEAHREAFQLAADHDLAITVHAGEADGPESIRQAIHRCHARRIGHGTRLIEDPSLEAYVNDFRIPLEVCPTSNVQTRAVASLAQHPLRHYFDTGLVVTLNTDNRLISGTTLTEEYFLVHEHLGFNWDELVELTLMGFQAGFLPFQAKLNLLEEVERELEEIG